MRREKRELGCEERTEEHEDRETWEGMFLFFFFFYNFRRIYVVVPVGVVALI